MKIKYQIFFVLILVALVSCAKTDEPRAKTVLDGSWRCEETNLTTGEYRTYLVELDHLTKDTTQYFISNFHKVTSDDGIVAKLTVGNIKLSSQPIAFTSIVLSSGSGVVSADFKQIVLDYDIFDRSNEYKIHAVYLK